MGGMMSDDEFDKLMDLGIYGPPLRQEFTDGQLTRLCHKAVQWAKASALIYQPLASHHFDILLAGSHYARLLVVTKFDSLEPRIIQKLLDDESFIVRKKAASHPSCTEAQKVRYHLTYGDD